MIHAFGIGSHHEMQKLEVENALETLNSAADGSDNNVDLESIMSVDTAFHCVTIEGQEGEYVLQHTDMTTNCRRGDDLEPDLLSPVDNSESSKADTREKPAKSAAKNKASAKKRKAPAKGGPTSSRKRKIEAKVDEEQGQTEGEEQRETDEVTQGKKAASKRARRVVNYKE